MTKTRAERRKARVKAIKHGEELMKNLGPKKGRVSKKHVDKVEKNSGYFDGGDISQYVNTKPSKNVRDKNHYGKSEDWSPRDARQMLDTPEDYEIETEVQDE